MADIIQEPHPTLRGVAAPVPVDEIKSEKVQGILADMKTALSSQFDGVAIAAPQIDVPLRIFVVSGQVFTRGKRNAKPEPDRVFINPEFTKLSKHEKWMAGEGCLSVRWRYGETKRHTSVTIRAYNEDGNLIEMGVRGLLAHIMQHEVDHLNGILFVDHARNVHEAHPDELI